MTNETRKKVRDLLKATPRRPSQSILAKKPDLVEAIQYFLELKRKGDDAAHVSFTYFYNHKLKPAFDGPSVDSARKYVTNVLRLDVQTGEKLDG